MTDEREHDRRRPGAERATQRANEIVDALLLALRDHAAAMGPAGMTTEVDRTALVAISLLDSCEHSPYPLVAIAAAAVVRLEKVLAAQPVTRAGDDR